MATRVRLENVHYHYPDTGWILRGVDLAIDAGITAGLGGDVVDTEALAEAPRWHRAESNMMFVFCFQTAGYFHSTATGSKVPGILHTFYRSLISESQIVAKASTAIIPTFPTAQNPLRNHPRATLPAEPFPGRVAQGVSLEKA